MFIYGQDYILMSYSCEWCKRFSDQSDKSDNKAVVLIDCVQRIGRYLRLEIYINYLNIVYIQMEV